MVDGRGRVDLLAAVAVLHEHLTTALCERVWDEVRGKERRRQLTLSVLAQFWTAVILRAPPSLTHALEEAQRGGSSRGKGTYPKIEVSPQAFFSRCQGLSPAFFERLFEAFQSSLEAAEPPEFARPYHDLAQRFGGRIWALDASALDKVGRRLKVLRNDRRVPLPGTVIACFDVCRGRLARLRHTRELQPQESPCALEFLSQIPPGTLLIADRLYGRASFLRATSEHGAWVLARHHGRVKFQAQQLLGRYRVGKARVEDWVGILGTGEAARPVRMVCVRQGKSTIDLVTNVMDTRRLGAVEACEIYRCRWRVERLFYELKRVLNLHRFYAGNLSAVSMQVHAAAILHLALRTAQARIARQVGIEPEALSIEKLFPKVAAASSSLTTAEVTFDAVEDANPGVVLNKPDWRKMPFAEVRLKHILVERRGPGGRRRRIKPDGRNLRRLPDPHGQWEP